MSRRTHRVEDLLRSELSQLLLRQVGDPRVRMTTVSAVEVSPDLKRALVRVSVVGEEATRKQALEGVRHARGFLRSQLARRLRGMRTIPDLIFELDRGAEHSQRISELLENLEENDETSR